MGWFGLGGGSGSGDNGGYSSSPSTAVLQFEQQIEIMDLVFRKAVRQCGQKCIPPNYKDGELNKGESVCTQRCFTKFFDSLELVSAQLAEVGMQAQQNAGGIPTM